MNSLIYRIRQKMAPSKHHFDVAVDETNNRLDKLYNSLGNVENKNSYFNCLADRIDMYAISQLKIEHPELDDHAAKIMLFHNLPAATGDMELYQQANSKLLYELDKICRQNNLRYWMWAGSAIATETRGAAIPWDDDIDVCIMRDDLEKLILATKDNPEYAITICYDYRAKNIQYRFVSRNKNILNFIDLVACDYATAHTPEKDAEYKELKQSIIDEFATTPRLERWRKESYIYNKRDNVSFPQRAYQISSTIDGEEARTIDSIYAKYHRIAVRRELLTDSPHDSTAIAYGLDGLFNFPKRQDIWDKSIIFPLADKKYDNFEVMVAHDNKAFCGVCYDNWPYIPHTIKYGEHSLNQLDLHPEYHQALIDFVNK